MSDKTSIQSHAERIVQLSTEPEKYATNIRGAMVNAARARCVAVEVLYTLLGIEATSPRQHKMGTGIITELDSDRSEDLRAGLLVQAVARLVAHSRDH